MAKLTSTNNGQLYNRIEDLSHLLENNPGLFVQKLFEHLQKGGSLIEDEVHNAFKQGIDRMVQAGIFVRNNDTQGKSVISFNWNFRTYRHE